MRYDIKRKQNRLGQTKNAMFGRWHPYIDTKEDIQNAMVHLFTEVETSSRESHKI